MPTEIFAYGLMRVNVSAGLAVLLVLALRTPIAHRWGADAAYRLWRMVPAAAAASLFPGLGLLDGLHPRAPAALSDTIASVATVLDAVWLAGVLASVTILALREAAFRREAAHGRAGPAVMGALWPRLVTPNDFLMRFTPDQRVLIVAHERAHISRGDTGAALMIAAAEVLAWFNPLVRLAARLARLDQELACDAQVLAARPDARRIYAAALLRAGTLSGEVGAASCTWRGRGSVEARLRAISRPVAVPPPGVRRSLHILPFVVALAIWVTVPADDSAAPPPRPLRPITYVDMGPPQAPNLG